MNQEKTVTETNDVETPEIESAPVDRFVRQTLEASDDVAVRKMPTEPGLYVAWHESDSEPQHIARISGNAPSLSV